MMNMMNMSHGGSDVASKNPMVPSFVSIHPPWVPLLYEIQSHVPGGRNLHGNTKRGETIQDGWI